MTRFNNLLRCYLILLLSTCAWRPHAPPCGCRAFNAHLTRPWKFKRGHVRIRTRKKEKEFSTTASSNLLTVSSSTMTTLSSSSSSSSTNDATGKNETSTPNNESSEMGNNNDKQQEQHLTTRMTPPLLETNSSSLTALRQALNPAMTAATEKRGAPTPHATVWNQLGPLTQLTRPQNFPGIFCFHVLGIYIALQSANRMDLFVTVLLAKPSMWLVRSAVILVSCTSVSNGCCCCCCSSFE